MLDETAVPGPLFRYKILRDVTTLSSVIRTETHQDAAVNRPQMCEVNAARIEGRAPADDEESGQELVRTGAGDDG